MRGFPDWLNARITRGTVAVEKSGQVEEGRLSAPARTHHPDKLTLLYRQ